MKIKSIQFFDYRAFFNGKDEQYLLSIEGNNVLVYGENGSGKTSFYRGLKDFINPKDFVSHNQTPRLNEGFIEIQFDDLTTERFDDTGIKSTKREVLNSSKLNSFLSYKELLRTHFFEEEQNEINLYNLLVENVLREHNLATLGKLGESWEVLKSRKISEEFEGITLSAQTESISADTAKDQIEKIKDEYKNAVQKYNDELKHLLVEINGGLKNILKYFDKNLEVELVWKEVKQGEFDKAKISTRVIYFRKEISNHHDFLNEARLSALALSVYLSAIKTNPTANTLKLMFLDDVFVGLDMSNRIPLLEILNTEFNDWQLFMTTYDRHWFEVAKRKLQVLGNWSFFEMYAFVEKDNGTPPITLFEKPIIKASQTNLANALRYLNSQFDPDYPACANYLRRANEELIRKHLPIKLQKAGLNEESGELQKLMLKDLYDCTLVFLKRLNQDISTLEELKKQHLKTLLNPLSHFDIETPLYKRELEVIIELTEKLENSLIDFKPLYKEILSRQSFLRFSFNLTNVGAAEKGYYEFKIKDDLYVYNDGGVLKLSNLTFQSRKTYTTSNGVATNLNNLPEWGSIEEGYNKCYQNGITSFAGLQKEVDYINAVEYKDEQGNWQSLRGIFVL
ncbi:MAG: hypothetical protein IT233_00585 [Bacteroidia bacterium]|nr:hypothetical protein [Bacteroidia bacterium]